MERDTLKDLAEHCYEKWLKTSKAALPSGAIRWMRDDLGEPKLAGQVEEILAANIKPSEKCYRFLKLTGVIERERLIQLLRKQTLDELEEEKAQQLEDIENNYQREIDEQWKRTFNKPAENSNPFIVFAIIAAIVCGLIGAVSGGRLGWAIGLFVGVTIAYFYRAWRANDGARQWQEQRRGAVAELRAAKESNIKERARNIDAEILSLIDRFSAPLSEAALKGRASNEAETIHQPLKELKGNLRGQYAGLVAIIGFLIIMPLILFKSQPGIDSGPKINQTSPSGEKLQMQERDKPYYKVINSSAGEDRKAIAKIYTEEPYEYECDIKLVDNVINKFELFVNRFPRSEFIPEALENIAWLELYSLQCPIPNEEKTLRLEKGRMCYQNIFTKGTDHSWGKTAQELYELLLGDHKSIDGLGYRKIAELTEKLKKQIPRCANPE